MMDREHVPPAHAQEAELAEEGRTRRALLHMLEDLQREQGELRLTQEALREREADLARAQRVASLGSWTSDLAGNAVKWSAELHRIFGHDARLPAPCQAEQARMYTPESWTRLQAAIARTLSQGTPYELELEIIRADETSCWIQTRGEIAGDGRAARLHGTAMDISVRKAAQDKVLHQAQFDMLTDLPNRSLFGDRLAQALHQARRQSWSAGVMFMDLDRFKAVNDNFGHAAGDALLCQVARRLAAGVRASDTVARVGGDEFAVVLAQIVRPRDVAVVAQNILKAMAAPLSIGGHECAVAVSIGIALYPEHGQDAETLMRHADAAMFEAKHAGGNVFRFHAPSNAAARAKAA